MHPNGRKYGKRPNIWTFSSAIADVNKTAMDIDQEENLKN